MSTLTEDALALKALKKQKDDAKKEASRLEAEHKAAEAALRDRMEQEGVEGIKSDGTNFVPTDTTYGQITDRSEFVKWARDNAPELLQEQEIGERINALARQLIDDGEEFPPGLSYRVREYISQRAA